MKNAAMLVAKRRYQEEIRNMIRALPFLLICLFAVDAFAESPGWRRAKNTADDIIYDGKDRTFYCGCVYTSNATNNGSGTVDHAVCGYEVPDTHSARAGRVEWEHIVPASLMPARQFDCWQLGNRDKCEREDPRAQGMLFDLHNLAPSVGQVNALRSNDRYEDELPESAAIFGECEAKDVKGGFEPSDCLKGDVARVWLFMSFRHGVVISEEEREMFEGWSEDDPVSPWESEREALIFDHTFVQNPFVHGVATDPDGMCPWE